MNNKLLILFIVLLSTIASQAQILNSSLVSHVDYTDSRGNGNDVWGYVSPDGTEYAVVATTLGTLIYDISDPTAPVEIKWIPGSQSTWRDVKVWEEFVYVTTDAGTDGLLIINMANAPNDIEYQFIKPEVFDNNGASIFLDRCHNIFIDEYGIIYLAGCQGRGIEFFDPKDDPWNPTLLGSIIQPYAHDAYAKNNILHASQLTNDFMLYDVTDKSNPIPLGSVETTKDFTHNAWGNPDNTLSFTTDEKPYGQLDAYDISDPTNIKFLDSWSPKNDNSGIIPHNTHYFEGYLVTSWYTSGLVVVDGNRPTNLVKVAEYDTYQGPDGGFNGMWGATPYLPSGLVLCNDINSGFYIFDVDYKRACYLEGTVTDASTGAPINKVYVEYADDDMESEETSVQGEYKNGRVTPGKLAVTFNHPEYISKTVEFDLVTSEVTIGDVQLVPKSKSLVNIQVVDKGTQELIENSELLIKGEGINYSYNTNLANDFYLVDGVYDIYAAKWGYGDDVILQINVPEVTDIKLELEEGYYDSFVIDLGWIANNVALTGDWVREKPNGTFDGQYYNPNSDKINDLGDKCYVTGNLLTNEIGADDIDGGTNSLSSPIMDWSEYEAMKVAYSTWFVNAGGNTAPNDNMEIHVSNGSETFLIEEISGNDPKWNDKEYVLTSNDLDFTDEMRIIVYAGDVNGGHLVEAGFDVFSATSVVGYKEISQIKVDIFPNPSNGKINLTNSSEISNIKIYNIDGVELMSITDVHNTIDISNLNNGLYTIISIMKDGSISSSKLSLMR